MHIKRHELPPPISSVSKNYGIHAPPCRAFFGFLVINRLPWPFPYPCINNFSKHTTSRDILEEYVREQLLEEPKQENDQVPLTKQSDSFEEKYGNNRGKESTSHQNKIPLSVSSEEANENTEELMADTSDNNNESSAAEADRKRGKNKKDQRKNQKN